MIDPQTDSKELCYGVGGKTSLLKQPAGANREPFAWHEFEGLQMKGCVDDESVSKLAGGLSKGSLVDEDFRFLATVLAGMQGPFALYFENENIAFAATDRIRSFPLAYHTQGGFDFRCSFEFQDVGDIDSDSISELLGFGYVTGSASASRRWQQLLAGQYVVFHKHLRKLEVRDYYLYPFSLRNEEEGKLPLGLVEVERALSELDSVHLQIIDRLIGDLSGRQVVVALSGGYDSRLIVELLSRRNYENVVCFTYGNRDDAQSKKAAKIAKHCGFRWLFIPYDESTWKRMFASEEFRRYQEWCTQLVSIPHIADWPAVKFLTKNALIDPDAIIVSGMSGDFLEGRHMPKVALSDSVWSVERVADSIIAGHFVHYPSTRLNVAQIRNKVTKEVSSLYETAQEWGVDHENMALALSYAWEWRNRQAKYTCNSVRVYEWHGHEWRLPLWDNVLMDFWAVVPVDWQKDRWLYREYVKRFS
ncbi:MAG TPA: asparagine synthase-related protein, partial [Rhodothermales bacterium]|nr:asparagine synthase-related protein [Rhodothermales bacterium]